MEPNQRALSADPNPRASLLILDSQEAKKVLENYVKRSLSNCEAKTRGYEIFPVDLDALKKDQKGKKLERSASDFGKYSGRKSSGAVFGTVQTKRKVVPRAEIAMDQFEDFHDETKPSQKDEAMENESTSATDKPTHKVGKPAKIQPSWIKNIINFFTKRKDEDESKVNHKDPTGKSTAGCKEHVFFVDQCMSCQGLVKSSKKKGSLKKGFSFKKSVPEEGKLARPMDAKSAKLNRPNHLPLKRVAQPKGAGERNSDCFYSNVSAEIEHIVKQNEDQEDRLCMCSSNGDLAGEDKEVLIRKIASMLQKKGDEWDKKIKEDPQLNTFFKDISYNSFKQLADIYVDKEVKKKVVALTPEEVKFAFTVHLTARVAGISPHPASRIMGFGKQYLQDTMAQLAYSRKGWDNDKVLSEVCQSPD